MGDTRMGKREGGTGGGNKGDGAGDMVVLKEEEVKGSG